MTRPQRIAGFAAAALVNALLLWHFHDRYWYPTDDGIHAHVAERLLAGEVLARDVQDIHPGYVHFLNTAAFAVFGVDLVSLRYPLILAAFIQSCLIYGLLERRGAALAAAGSLAATGLGVLQFMSPTANWYALSLAASLVCWLTWLPAGHRARRVGAGVLLGLMTLSRQLTGIWVAMAMLVLFLIEESRSEGDDRGVLGRGLLLIMLAGLAGYLLLSPETNTAGVLLIALWPAAILLWALLRVRVPDRRVVALVAEVGSGAVLAALPLLLYLAVHGSLGAWLHDVILVATGHTTLEFFGTGWYGVLPVVGLHQAVTSGDPVKFANGVYWVLLPLLPSLNGILTLRRLRSWGGSELALPVVATFYALVSLYLQGPLYLYYTVGLVLASILWLRGAEGRLQRVTWATLALALAVVGISSHAGQSRHRTPGQILAGETDTDVWSARGAGLERATLHLNDEDRGVYRRFIESIRAETSSGDAIFVLPNNSELYFLSRRSNPTRFYNSTMGLTSNEDLRALIEEMTARPPRLVIFRPDDKFNTTASRALMDAIRPRYLLTDVVDGAEVYRLRDGDRTN